MKSPTVIKAYYDSPEGQVHYRYVLATEGNVPKSPILLLHMSACSSLYYEELMQRCAAEGHDCYAPDMPGFGGSYDPLYQPAGISYYVDCFMLLVKQVGISKFHVIGHHSGASIATEMAVLHPDQVLGLFLAGPALLNSEEQDAIRPGELIMYNKPVADGSHWKKSWDYVNAQGGWDVVQLHGQVLDTVRAYEGRIQIYTCVFSQPMIELLGKVKCPILALSSEKDVLHAYTLRTKEVRPDASIAVVQGGDFEVMRDAEGVCKEMMHFIKETANEGGN